MTSLFRRGLVAALLWMVAAGTGAAASEAKPQFFVPGPVATKAANAPGIKSRAKPVRFNAEQMLALPDLAEVELVLPGAGRHDLVLDRTTPHGGGMASWVGRLKGHGNHYRVVITTGPGGSFGAIDTPTGRYNIVPGGDHDWLVDLDQENRLLDVAPQAENDAIKGIPTGEPTDFASRAMLSAPIPGLKVTPTPQATIDMMFVVTNGLASRLGTTLATRLNFLVTRANTSYTDSEIAITLRMVNYTVVNYPDNTSDTTALNAISPGNAGFNAVFANIEAVRATYGADMVSLLRDGGSTSGSGVAWVISNFGVATSPNFMYSTMQGCVTGCESVWIHEVGHNMGSNHDRATDSWQDGGAASQPATNYGYAFCKSGAHTCNAFLTNGTPGACTTNGSQPECTTSDPSNFSDIMSYFHGTTTRLYKFSNPGVNCRTTAGDQIDRPCGAVQPNASGTADAAGMLNSTRTNISGYRTAPASLAGSLQFTATGYSRSEAASPMTFTVSRANGSSGAASVNYTVTGGTAVAGADFTAASGTLNWANGDTADKTFTVTLVNDGLTEGAESFTATLSSPSAGAFVGYPPSAVALITEDFGGAVGGALPAGYASADWTIANDQAFDGATSLRSAQPTGDMVTYNNSDLTYTGTIPAGTIAFAYRVSSYQGYGVFEFSVDGTVVLSDTGETGWKLYTYALQTGGSHTLRWRYKNRLSSRCNLGWNPPAQGGANCADRVWIDSVSLPATVAPGAELALAQAAAPSPASAGKDVVFTLTITNNGPATANAVTLTNPLPAGSSYIWASPGCGFSGGTVTCTRSSLASGANTVFKIVARPAAAGSITNNASAAATEPDSVSANNSASTTVTVNATPVAAQAQRYRLYSPVTLEHHFTTDLNEYTVLGTLVGTWVQEGTVGKVLNNPGSFAGVAAVPYYRLYDNNTRWHHWTTDANEYYTLSVQFPWWNGEGVDGYILPTQATGTVPLYRLLYPFVAGLHHWTIDSNEYNTLITPAFGWIGEGGSGFVIP